MSDLVERQTVAVILDIAQRAAECSGDLTSLWIEREMIYGVAHVRIKTDIVDVLMPEKAFDIITGRAALASRLEALEAEVEALDQKCSALAVAHGPNTCGCSYDAPRDICAAHSPQLMAARARIEALEKAAAPFESEAQFALYCSPDDLDDDHELQLGPITVTIGDLRALARAANGDN